MCVSFAPVIPILGDANSSWHHGQTTRRKGNYLKLNNDFAYDHCTVARLEESASPRIGIRRSPSQCPGTARSSISAGRSRMETISRICPCPLFALWLLGRRMRRAVRKLRRQLLLEHAAGLDEEATIDRFVRYLHVLVGWELLLQPAGDLLRRPLQRELLRHAPS